MGPWSMLLRITAQDSLLPTPWSRTYPWSHSWSHDICRLGAMTFLSISRSNIRRSTFCDLIHIIILGMLVCESTNLYKKCYTSVFHKSVSEQLIAMTLARQHVIATCCQCSAHRVCCYCAQKHISFWACLHPYNYSSRHLIEFYSILHTLMPLLTQTNHFPSVKFLKIPKDEQH